LLSGISLLVLLVVIMAPISHLLRLPYWQVGIVGALAFSLALLLLVLLQCLLLLLLFLLLSFLLLLEHTLHALLQPWHLTDLSEIVKRKSGSGWARRCRHEFAQSLIKALQGSSADIIARQRWCSLL
jgi:hypothetical protein